MDQARKIVAVSDTSEAGILTFWRLSGEVDPAKLDAAWTAAGLPTSWLPTLPSPQVALRRAADSLRAKRRLVRPIADGFAIVDESEPTPGQLDYATAARATLAAGDVLTIEPANSPLAAEVHAAYQRARLCYDASDISECLVRLASRLSAVALRDRGGVYFVPPDQAETWRRAVGAIERSSSHAIYEIPALRSDAAVRAILDALVREADEARAAIDGEIAEGEVGRRALETRKRRCTEIEQKIAGYEKLLDSRLDDLRSRLQATQAGIAGALLAAESEAA